MNGLKYAWKVTSILLGIIAGIVLVLFLVMNYFINHHTPKGDLLTETVSPNGNYTVNTYVIHGNATVANSIRGEVVYHNKKDKKKTIYKGYREEEAEVIWLDDHTVSINSIELDVRKDVYDWRADD